MNKKKNNLFFCTLLMFCVSSTSHGQTFGEKAKIAAEVPLMVIGAIADIPNEMVWHAREKRDAKIVRYDWRINSLAGKFECYGINKRGDIATHQDAQADSMCTGQNPLSYAVALSLDSYFHCYVADARTAKAVELIFDVDPTLCNWTDEQIKFNSIPAAKPVNSGVRYSLWYFNKNGPAPLGCRSYINGQWGEKEEDISYCRIEDPKPLSQFRIPGTY